MATLVSQHRRRHAPHLGGVPGGGLEAERDSVPGGDLGAAVLDELHLGRRGAGGHAPVRVGKEVRERVVTTQPILASLGGRAIGDDTSGS